MIKDYELGIIYYNLRKWHYSHWSTTEDTRTIRQKIGDVHRGKSLPEYHKKALMEGARKSNKDRVKEGTHNFLNRTKEFEERRIEAVKEKLTGKKRPPELMKRIGEKNKGRKPTEEAREKNRLAGLGKTP